MKKNLKTCFHYDIALPPDKMSQIIITLFEKIVKLFYYLPQKGGQFCENNQLFNASLNNNKD